jgi:large subunit ribosomal protein L4e
VTSVKTYSLKGKAGTPIELPAQFATPYRPDIIKRAVLALQSLRYQPHGVDELAGKRTSAQSWQTGRAKARVPRVKGAGSRASSQGAFVPGTVGGRQAHPPETRKVIVERINIKERRLAIRSAIAATANSELVKARGHRIESVPQIPLVVSDDLESLDTTKAVEEAASALGLSDDLKRASDGRSIRAGKGKMRGRKMKTPKSFLIVVSSDKGIRKAARNLPGVDTIEVHGLNAEQLAPGTHPGRLVVWTEAAISELEKGNLFM